MVQTCRHECFGLCAALDSAMKPCQATAASGLPWCSRHNEERMKLYLNYKTHHNSLRKIDQTTACTTAPRVRVCASLDRLRAWHGSLMCKYRLITRCIDAREYFTERFFGNDMDFGHQQFWRALVKQQTDTERLLSEVERRTYELILISQNALWVLKQSNDPSDSTLECSGYDDSSLLKISSSDTDSDSNSSRSFERKLRQCQNAFADVEDPLEVALREKATTLREKIYTRMARYCAPAESKLYKERLEVIYALVRRAVYTDASLMVQCQAYESVMEFLEDADLEVNTLEKFWTALKELYTNEARAAIDDVLRPKDDTSDAADYVVLLGGRVYKTQSGMQWPFRAWAHFTSIVKCYTCLRNICVSVDEVAGLTRYVILTRINVNQSYLKCWHPVERGSALMLCGSLVNNLEPTQYNPRYTISKCNSCLDRRPQWSETETNLVLCMGLSLTDPKAKQFVEACKQEPDFMILCRHGRDGEVVRSQERIWYKRIRRARTRGGLKKVNWESVGKDSILYLRDSVLQETFVQTTRTVKLQDCYQLAVVDTQAEDITAVVGKLAAIWMKVYGAECAHQLWDSVGKDYVESGELEIQDEPSIESVAGCCPCKSYVPGIEKNVLASYCRLWNRTPVGRVSDD